MDTPPQPAVSCRDCGYDLTGLELAQCPECGTIHPTGRMLSALTGTGDAEEPRPSPIVSASRVCAVCGAPIADPEARRCGVCHSRYVVAGAGGEGDLASMARSRRLSVLPPSADAPPRRNEQGLIARFIEVYGHGPAIGLGMCAVGIIVWQVGYPMVGLPIAFAGLLVIMHAARLASRNAKLAALTNACRECGYPLEPGGVGGAAGRCPECGIPVRFVPHERRFCPSCRRSLRDFHGDSCPDCGSDIRAICEPANPT